jgi:transposase-like protein
MPKIPESCSPVNARSQFESALLEAETSLRQNIALNLANLLAAIVEHVLNRPYYRRRTRVSKRLRREGKCCRCGSRRSHHFTRNGFRRRQLLTRWGELSVDVPRVRCECGGSIRIDFGDLIRPYQRIWDDVDAQIQRWGALAVSLRQMRQELEHLHIGPDLPLV